MFNILNKNILIQLLTFFLLMSFGWSQPDTSIYSCNPDMNGQFLNAVLVNTNQKPGFRSVQWDATDAMGRPVSAGVYLYQIQAGEFVQTRKMVLLK